MLKVQQYVDAQTLRQWVNRWDESVYINYFNEKIADRMKRMKVRSSMEENIVKIKTLCNGMSDEFAFTEFMGLMNRIVFNCYFKQGESALQLANFYEEILVPADQTTRNRMFGYKDGKPDIGDLMMQYQGEAIGHLGEQSDMFRLIFDVCFSAEDSMFDGSTDLMEDTPPFLLAAQEENLITLKVWKHNALDLSMDRFVDLFLYHCSTHLGLNFKRASFEAPPDMGLDALHEVMEFQPFEAEQLPLMYFNSAAHNLPPQMVFMSYYHVLDYFFERAGHHMMHEQMQSMFQQEETQNRTQLQRMVKTIRMLNENLQENDLLELVLEGVLTPEALTDFMQWLDADAHRKRWFTHFHEKDRDLPVLRTTSRQDLLRSLVQRIHGIKATLCGEQSEEASLQKPLSTQRLQQELPLMKYLASGALEVWSKPL